MNYQQPLTNHAYLQKVQTDVRNFSRIYSLVCATFHHLNFCYIPLHRWSSRRNNSHPLVKSSLNYVTWFWLKEMCQKNNNLEQTEAHTYIPGLMILMFCHCTTQGAFQIWEYYESTYCVISTGIYRVFNSFVK